MTHESLLEGMTLSIFGYYFLWSCFGKLISVLLQLYKSKGQIKANGGFQWGYYIKSNWPRFLVTLSAMVVGVLFTESLLGVKLNELTAITAGFSTDVIVDRLFKGRQS